MENDLIICVACNRKQKKFKRSCACGHVFHESIDTVDTTTSNSISVSHRLRKKRYTASLDDSAVDLVLDKLLGIKSRKEPLKRKVYLSLGTSNGLEEKGKKHKKHHQSLRPNGNQMSAMKSKNIQSTIRRCHDDSQIRQNLNEDDNMNQVDKCSMNSTYDSNNHDCNPHENSYRIALEEINTKLIRQNGICRIAYF